MAKPTVSVILTNYNHAHNLPRSLGALVEQTHPADEIVVIDDKSTDNSIEVIESYAARYPNVRLVKNERNMGVVATINRALEHVQCDFVYGAAADDFVQPTFLEKSVAVLAAHPEAGMCCTIGDWRDERTGLISHIGVGMGEKAEFFPPEKLEELEREGRLMIPSNAVLFKTDHLREIGGFDPELKWHCDWFSMYAMAFRHGLCFVPEPLAVFFMHAAGYSAKNPAKVEQHKEVMRKIIEKLERPEFDDVRPAIQRSGALFCFGWPMRRHLKSDPKLKSYLNPTFLRKNLWYAFKVGVKGYLPKWAGDLYFWLTGARAKKVEGDSPASASLRRGKQARTSK